MFNTIYQIIMLILMTYLCLLMYFMVREIMK